LITIWFFIYCMNLLCSTFPYLDDCGNSSTGFTAVNEHRETLSRKRNSKDLSMGKLDSLTFKFIRFTTNMCSNNFSIKGAFWRQPGWVQLGWSCDQPYFVANPVELNWCFGANWNFCSRFRFNLNRKTTWPSSTMLREHGRTRTEADDPPLFSTE
jgi:hypothetical protein